MFDYLGVLVSVILGLALTHLLTGLSRLIQMRSHVRVYWVHVAWTLNIMLYVLGLWWGMYWWKHLEDWTIGRFLFLSGYASVIYVLSALLYPHEVADGFDFEVHFESNRRWFFGAFVLAILLDIPETLSKGVAHLRDVPTHYVAFITIMLVLGTAGLLFRARKAQGIVASMVLLGFLAYFNLTTLERIIVQ
jgi:hypothetical protein